jgi:hypothetical protein
MHGLMLAAALLGTATLPQETLVQGHYSGFETGLTDPREFVIESSDEWKNVWSELTSDTAPAAEAPEVDFTLTMVLGLATHANTGGYSLTIHQVEEMADELVARATLVRPGSGCIVTMALTQPHHFVAVPRRDKAVRFDVTRKLRDCRD